MEERQAGTGLERRKPRAEASEKREPATPSASAAVQKYKSKPVHPWDPRQPAALLSDDRHANAAAIYRMRARSNDHALLVITQEIVIAPTHRPGNVPGGKRFCSQVQSTLTATLRVVMPKITADNDEVRSVMVEVFAKIRNRLLILDRRLVEKMKIGKLKNLADLRRRGGHLTRLYRG
jgi:hypothetical protein